MNEYIYHISFHQRHVRGFLARKLATRLKEQKRKEEERKRKEEMEREKRDREKEAADNEAIENMIKLVLHHLLFHLSLRSFHAFISLFLSHLKYSFKFKFNYIL